MRELRKETESLDDLSKLDKYISIRNERTPKGDGNVGLINCFIVSSVTLIRNERTPKGDGNEQEQTMIPLLILIK